MYSEINPYIEKLTELSDNSNSISPDMYKEHKVFRGLRDQKQGRGHTKAPAQHDAMRTHEKLLHLIYWLISYS